METQRCWNPWCGMQVVISGLILLMGIRSIEAAPQGSLVTFLPGFNGTFPSKHYTGYVNFEEKNLFYYFVTSERNPIKDPVVLWLNGGPGCSSFDGFVYEHGPFNFGEGQPKGSLPILHLNPYSWSKVSNIIYLDSPCGVGLSYSLNKTNYVTDDLKTAADTHTFLLKWFDLYPEFVENPFYISGESYAGVYVPTLAVEVVKGIKADKKPIINFKGYLIGNGVTHSKFDGVTSLMSFGHGMGLISDDHFEAAEKDCKRNFEDPSTQCYQSVIKALQSLRGLNIYNILEPCYHDPEAVKKVESNISSTIPLSFQQLGVTERPLKVRKRMFGRGWPLWSLYGNGPLPSWSKLALEGSVPCVDDEIATAWLNDKDVRKAIHANPISDTGPWELCVDIDYNYNTGSMLPYHKNLTMQGYRALIYSGDHDMCVPFTGTQAWTGSLSYTKVEDWRPWLSSTQQVAGYIQRFNHNLTFLTIKGAGHTVPEYKPQESLDFYSRWLDGKSM